MTWRTQTAQSSPLLEVEPVNGGDRKTFQAESKPLRHPNFPANEYYEASASGLNPNTRYRYRVGGGGFYSSWRRAQTANSKPAPFKFLWVGDAQTYIKRVCTEMFGKAQATAPDARFIIHAGDLIDDNLSAAEWGEWHSAVYEISKTIPTLATPGNHEYGVYGRGKFKGLSPLWMPTFAPPTNGPPGYEKTTWYLDYQGLRVISLDSLKPLEPQIAWMEKLPQTPKPLWTVVTQHYPVFVSMKGQEAPGRTKLLSAAFERLGVDLVMTGHLHSYARSGLVKGGSFDSKEGGVVYAISVAGGKFYKQDKFPWMKKAFARVSTFQTVEVEENRMVYKAIDKDGVVRDQFRLERSSPDAPSRLIEEPTG